MKTVLFLLSMIAATAAPAQTAGPPAKAREPVFSNLIGPAVAHPAPTNSAPAATRAATPTPGTNDIAGHGAWPAGYVADDKYKLRAGDRVSLQIIEDREVPKSLLITDSGEMDAPYIGRVPAADKTCKQLAAELKAKLEQEYYYRATVVLALDAANKFWGRIYVWGQVKNQGPIDVSVNENLTAGKAILRAGGFADFANKRRVKLVRAPVAGVAVKPALELNMTEILEDGRTDKDVALQPDDSIIVPSRLINF